ncbi:MAG: GTP pyrophosphokinase [Anaerolineae bacterium]|nr:GTP pyrophosphokinase [Anaerolineae bacterium]MCO5190651.1 GTP pyrophosphokinase [Anaerolineae bacterium]
MSQLEKAITIALTSHAGQVQKNGDPYVLHPLHLMCQMETETERIVAVLHDVIEDTEMTLDDLAASGFSAEIITTIDLLTHHPAHSYDEYIERIRPNRLARRIKLADLRHNMDVLRLNEITDRDLRRLRKYKRAWERLQFDRSAD